MAPSSAISNPGDNFSASREPKRSKKRRKVDAEVRKDDVKIDRTKWSTGSEQQIYSNKLIEALRQVRRNSSSPSSLVIRGRAVRATADRVLAVAAKGRTRWSRAILTSRRLNQMNDKHKKNKKARMTGDIRSKKPVSRRKFPALQRKVRVLGRLVPGCRKLSFPNLLEEAADYIAALEMQVRAMTALAGLLSGSSPPDRLPSIQP